MNAYIYDMKRTPIGKLGGCFKTTPPELLMAPVLKSLTSQLDPQSIDECIIANAVGPLGNIARLCALEADLPLNLPATSIDYQCGGSLKALEIGTALVSSGMKDALLIGGTESSSLEIKRYYHENDPKHEHMPYALPRAQFVPTRYGDVDMLQGAENTAQKMNFTRQRLDRLALESHTRANRASDLCLFSRMITPVTTQTAIIKDDTTLKPHMSLRLLQRAKPILSPEGLTSVGNACLMNDGAAGLLLASQKWGLDHQKKPMAQVLAITSVGCLPALSPLGAYEAAKKLLDDQGLEWNDLDLIEVNEAFASKVLAFHELTGISLDKINVSGGALAYGHPYAASGAIYLGHLIYNLKARHLKKGLIAMGVAGGQGIACLIEVTP